MEDGEGVDIVVLFGVTQVVELLLLLLLFLFVVVLWGVVVAVAVVDVATGSVVEDITVNGVFGGGVRSGGQNFRADLGEGMNAVASRSTDANGRQFVEICSRGVKLEEAESREERRGEEVK